MKVLFPIFLCIFSLAIFSCSSGDGCVDHTSGFDEVCGCPGLEVGFSGTCINTQEDAGYTFYFGDLSFKCFPDSLAVGISPSSEMIKMNDSNTTVEPFYIGSFGSNFRLGGNANRGFAECNEFANSEIASTELTWIIYDNFDEFASLPDEIHVTLLQKNGLLFDAPTLDSTTAILYIDPDRR